jgi:multiple sugar transport system permease protein
MATKTSVAERTIGAPLRKPKRNWKGWAFVGPFVAAFAFLLVGPLVYAISLSFFRDRLIGGVSFVGFDNFVQVVTDAQLWEGIGRVLTILAVQVPVMMGLALFAALAIDSARLAWAPFFRLMVFLPYAVPGVVAALMWGYIYGPNFGLVGNLNDFFGIDLPDPLGAGFVFLAIGNISTWLFTGYNMLVFISALKAVPGDLYEAAELDGASSWRVIRSIKMPALRPALTITLMFSVIGSFQMFNEPNILKALSPNVITSTFTPNMYAYTLSFAGGQYNLSATMALVIGILTMIAAYVVQRIGRRKDA